MNSHCQNVHVRTARHIKPLVGESAFGRFAAADHSNDLVGKTLWKVAKFAVSVHLHDLQIDCMAQDMFP